MKLKAGDRVYTPRFCTVKIKEVFASRKEAVSAGYCESTGYEADGSVVVGKVTDVNRMEFAAYGK